MAHHELERWSEYCGKVNWRRSARREIVGGSIHSAKGKRQVLMVCVCVNYDLSLCKWSGNRLKLERQIQTVCCMSVFVLWLLSSRFIARILQFIVCIYLKIFMYFVGVYIKVHRGWSEHFGFEHIKCWSWSPELNSMSR